MTAELDALLAAEPIAPPTMSGAKGRKCRRHQWEYVTGPSFTDFSLDPGWCCARCGKPKDEAHSRRGKNNRSRGNAYERELAAKIGGKRTGQFGGPDDVTSDLFVVQVKVRKAWPSWMADELAKLPRTGGRVPLLVVANAPGPGHSRKALVVVGLEDWISLHGPTP